MPDEPVLEPQDGETSSNTNLEDCVCPICMEYYIDAVETRCQHRFCNHCLNRWVSFNPNRKCPSCRRNIGLICSLPQLDISISNALRNALGDDEVRQREIVRVQRNTHDFTGDDETWSQQASALISRIRETRERIREFQNREGEQNRDGQPGTRLPVRSSNTRSARHRHGPLNEPLFETSSRFRSPRSILRNAREQSRSEGIETHFEFPNRSQPNRTESRRQVHIRQMHEDDIVAEYSYHLHRAESAYTRIKEGYREFDFHNYHLQQLYQQFTESRYSHPQRQDVETHVDYEDYQDLREIRRGSMTPPRSILPNNPPNNNRSPVTSTQPELSGQIDHTLRRVSNRLESMRRIRRDDAVRNVQIISTVIGPLYQERQSIGQQYQPSEFSTNHQPPVSEPRRDHIEAALNDPENLGNGSESISGAFFRAIRNRVSPNAHATSHQVNPLSMGSTLRGNINSTTTQRRGTRRQRSFENSRSPLERRSNSNNRHVNLPSRDEDTGEGIRSDDLILNLPLFNLNVPEQNQTPDSERPSDNMISMTLLTGRSSQTRTMQADEEAIRESLQEILNLDAILHEEIPVRDNEFIRFPLHRGSLTDARENLTLEEEEQPVRDTDCSC